MSTSATEVFPLTQGPFSVGSDKRFFPIGDDEDPAKGALKISLNPFLIKSPDRNILVDAGIGSFGEGTSCDALLRQLEKHGVADYEITDIFLSHLHLDHIGGLAERCDGYWKLTFPEAQIWVSEAGWHDLIENDPFEDEPALSAYTHFLDAKADLQFLGEEEEPFDGVSVRCIGGHTKFHQTLYFNFGENDRYLMAGDVLAGRSQVNRKFAAKFDYEPQQSLKMREELTRQAYEGQYTILGYHDNEMPVFKLIDYAPKKGYTIKNTLVDEKPHEATH